MNKKATAWKSVTQAQLAEMIGTSPSYISRLINKKDCIVNKVFVEMLEKLGFDSRSRM